MGILIKTVRIAGFRGLENIEVDLEPITVLTGMNNTGKTSFLKALQIAFGNRQFISQDDFIISDKSIKEIIIDVRIIPIDEDGKQIQNFSDDWEILFTEERIKTDIDGNQYFPFRTVTSFDDVKNNYRTKQYILPEWSALDNWLKSKNGIEKTLPYEEIPYFFMDAQRDILDDIKMKSSYLGKMISKIEYSDDDTKDIEKLIEELNDKTISKSIVLSHIKETLKELNSAMGVSNEGVEITPFTKKVRDLNKGLSIYYADQKDSFPMEYHGTGTRSWSSLLTLKSFILSLTKNANDKREAFFPILALEEPEAHLHPNAQKKLYSQMESIKGQKIISTHSPYIAASGKLSQIRNFYKNNGTVSCGKINTTVLSKEDIRKIERQVINTRGELFFSKIIVFFEGETEEQALPIFAEHYFKRTPIEMGIDFIGVSGHGNYLPFLRVAEGLQIPWLILSDGEHEVLKGLQKAITELYSQDTKLEDKQNIIILDKNDNFERYLLTHGYIDEIKTALTKLHSEQYLADYISRKQKEGKKIKREKTEERCDKCEQNIYKDIIKNYQDAEGLKEILHDCMVSQKTQFGPVIAEEIVNSGKSLPPKIVELFEKINILFNREK